jgi:hypothetical protein
VGFCCGQTEQCGRVSVWAARSARTRFSLQTGGFTRASEFMHPTGSKVGTKFASVLTTPMARKATDTGGGRLVCCVAERSNRGALSSVPRSKFVLPRACRYGLEAACSVDSRGRELSCGAAFHSRACATSSPTLCTTSANPEGRPRSPRQVAVPLLSATWLCERSPAPCHDQLGKEAQQRILLPFKTDYKQACRPRDVGSTPRRAAESGRNFAAACLLIGPVSSDVGKALLRDIDSRLDG